MCVSLRGVQHQSLQQTLAQGYDVAAHVLACFGGAGGQHACAIARALGMATIFVHRYAGILSAVGIGLADVVNEAQVRREAGLQSSLSVIPFIVRTQGRKRGDSCQEEHVSLRCSVSNALCVAFTLHCDTHIVMTCP